MLARLVTAFGMVHIITEYGAELALCEGPSMLPTIRARGEVILVDRLTPRIYGLQGGNEGSKRVKIARQQQQEYEEANKETKEAHKWHQTRVPVNRLQAKGKWRRFRTQVTTGISVGDVVMVQHPNRQGTVCKRVLGLPGDMVVKEPPRRNRRVGRRSFQQQEQQLRGNLVVVPDGHVWIEGDNSLDSHDSRYYGAVPAALIIGRVVCRVWPLRGKALMERGWRPSLPPGRPCTGSTILPAGYEGEEIEKQNMASND